MGLSDAGGSLSGQKRVLARDAVRGEGCCIMRHRQVSGRSGPAVEVPHLQRKQGAGSRSLGARIWADRPGPPLAGEPRGITGTGSRLEDRQVAG